MIFFGYVLSEFGYSPLENFTLRRTKADNKKIYSAIDPSFVTYQSMTIKDFIQEKKIKNKEEFIFIYKDQESEVKYHFDGGTAAPTLNITMDIALPLILSLISKYIYERGKKSELKKKI